MALDEKNFAKFFDTLRAIDLFGTAAPAAAVGGARAHQRAADRRAAQGRAPRPGRLPRPLRDAVRARASRAWSARSRVTR